MFCKFERRMCGAAAAYLLVMAAAAQSIPPGIVHQGYIEVDGEPFDGNGAFRFALLDGSGNNTWTNDSSELGTPNQPASTITLSVEDGIYAVVLGDGPTTDVFPADLFANNPALTLRVWFDDGENGVKQLTPDRPLHATPYTMQAQNAATAVTASGLAPDALPDQITVQSVNYDPPRTHVLSIGPVEFQPAFNGMEYEKNAASVTAKGIASLDAPVDLPQGATVVSLEAHFVDSDPDSFLEVSLKRGEAEGGSIEFGPIAVVDSSGFNAQGSDKTTEIDEPVIDHTTKTYAVTVQDNALDWDKTDSRLLQVLIEYEIGEAE